MSPMRYEKKINELSRWYPLIPIDNFKDHCIRVFEFTSMQKTTENRHHPEKFRDPLRLKLNFNFLLDHVTELFVLGERMSRVAVDKFGVVGKEPRLDIIFQ